jgi:hypothetical protein
MGRRLLVLGAATMLFAVVVATPASAAKPLYVEFELTTYFAPTPTDTFTASGPAVADGLMCGEGTKEELVPEKWSPPDPEKVTRSGQVISKYTCSTTDSFGVDDTFVIKAQMHFDVSGGGSAWVLNWVLTDGTGAFEGLHGNGSGSGSLIFDGPPPPIGAADTYVGNLH